MADTKKSASALIAGFFGKLPGQTTTGLLAEIKELSEDSRLELGQRIARQQGLTQDQVSFPL